VVKIGPPRRMTSSFQHMTPRTGLHIIQTG
jgi:hypothetical protein